MLAARLGEVHEHWPARSKAIMLAMKMSAAVYEHWLGHLEMEMTMTIAVLFLMMLMLMLMLMMARMLLLVLRVVVVVVVVVRLQLQELAHRIATQAFRQVSYCVCMGNPLALHMVLDPL
jgi:hypothetical protein